MIHVARVYGISDVALKKICKKMAIPTPPQGYWLRKESKCSRRFKFEHRAGPALTSPRDRKVMPSNVLRRKQPVRPNSEYCFEGGQIWTGVNTLIGLTAISAAGSISDSTH
jgi:hypothetical protein